MSFIYKNETSTTYPLYETMPCFILINKLHSWVQSALPTICLYSQSGYDQSVVKERSKWNRRSGVQQYFLLQSKWVFPGWTHSTKFGHNNEDTLVLEFSSWFFPVWLWYYIYGVNSAGNAVCQSDGFNLGIHSNVNFYRPWIQVNL